MRILYAMKNTVNIKTFNLITYHTINSLISYKTNLPYGAAIYIPSMSIIKHIAKHATNGDAHMNPSHDQPGIMKEISLLNSEKILKHFLKWAMGVNWKACNAGVCSETGCYPLIYECVNLTLKYAKRLKDLDNNSLISLAF